MGDQTVATQMLLIFLRPVGGVCPDAGGCVGLVQQLWQLRAVIAGGIGRGPFADQSVRVVDRDMVLVTEGGDRNIDLLCAILPGFGLGVFDRPAGIAILLGQLGGLGQSSGILPSLMARFSSSLLRCLGADKMVASTI